MTSLLSIEALTKQFSGLVAVDEVTFGIREGEILGLIGPNGAGKTTLFNMISGSLAPTAGQVHYQGQDITHLPPHRVCERGIARTFQIAKPFAHLSVVDNVKVGAFLRHRQRREANARAREMVSFVGLEKHADQPASALNTGGQKRLELARALATEPHLLLLDEVMAGLTPTESAGIVKLIKEIRDSGITILVIEHVMTAIMNLSDRIAVLHHGQLIAIDTPTNIASDQEVIEAYLGKEYTFAKD